MDRPLSTYRFGSPFPHSPVDPCPVNERLALYARRLERRRAAALEAGDMQAVWGYDDRIMRVEMFAMDLERWRVSALH